MNATPAQCHAFLSPTAESFNGHPPLGVNATIVDVLRDWMNANWFQWAPTLGGECYPGENLSFRSELNYPLCFNGHPPLGVNATVLDDVMLEDICPGCFNGHPPLGVNATCA